MMRTLVSMITVVLPSLVLGEYPYVAFDDGCKDVNGGEIVYCCPSWLYYPTTSFEQTLKQEYQKPACDGTTSSTTCAGYFNGVLSTISVSPSKPFQEFQAEMKWTILPCSASSDGYPSPNNYYKCETKEPTPFFTDPPGENGKPVNVKAFALRQDTTRADGIVSTTYYTVEGKNGGCERDTLSDKDKLNKKASVTLTIVPQCCMSKAAQWPEQINSPPVMLWKLQDDPPPEQLPEGVAKDSASNSYGTCMVDTTDGPPPPKDFPVDSSGRFMSPKGLGRCQGAGNGDIVRPDARFTGETANRAYEQMCKQYIITRDEFNLKATLNPTKNKNAGQIQFDVKSFKSGCTTQGTVSVLQGKFYPGKTSIVGFGAFLGPLWLSLTSLVVLFALFVGGWMYLFMATGCCALCIRCCKPPHTEEDDLFHDKELKNVTLRFAVKSGLTPEQRADDDKTMSARAVRT